jgi:tetratricopeptide (TPR) repeat protein
MAQHESLTAALQMHQAGQLAAAAQLYQQLLAREPDNADALHLFGVLRHQQGDHARAVELIGKAVALRPNAAALHANLAEAYRAVGQFERAAGSCRMALRLWPDFPEALCNLGLALQGLGKHAEAVEQYRRAVELRPDFAIAHSNLGNALRELGRLDEALKHFRRAVELAPDHAPARTNLGQLLVDRGRADEALPHCQEAVRLQPDLAPLHHNLGNALRALGRHAEARAAYLEAIRLDPNLARAHAHLGLVLQQEGQLGDALVWLRQAMELEPTNADFWQYLAELYSDREEQAEAIPCWQRVLALAPDRASAHNALGWALQEEHHLREAEEHFRTALRLQPDYAGAQMSLGGLHEELGDLTAAEAAFRAALRMQPMFALPHARLATLLRGKLSQADVAALEQRLADPELGEGPRARLLFGLAHVLDARGDCARAAVCLRQANALSLEIARRQKRDYSAADHERFVDNLVRAFVADWFARRTGAGLPTRRPVFVFGLPRSGTTLIEQVLASHSRIHGAGELRLARETFEAIPAVLGRPAAPMECVPALEPAAIRRLAEQHEEKLRALGGNAERVVDKMPDNYLYVGLLHALFPEATLIHCRRDLRDIAVSCWMTDFRSIRWANDSAHLASRFGQYRRAIDHWRRVLPGRMIEIDYEETVADLESVARRLIAACGLEWEPACLAFHTTQRPVRTASVTQVRQPVYTQSVARWKRYEREMGELFAALN